MALFCRTLNTLPVFAGLAALGGGGERVIGSTLGGAQDAPRGRAPVPAPTEAATRTDLDRGPLLRPNANSFRQSLPTARTGKSVPVRTWENVAMTIPPNRAGCGPEGAVLIATEAAGAGPRIWRGSLKCFASKKSTCNATSDVILGSPNWPAVQVPGFSDYLNGADKQLVRFPDGTILLVQQGVRRDAGTTAPCEGPDGTCRGAEFFFHSTDCGSTWRLVSVQDPVTDGPASEPDRYYDHSTQHGHDRPELYADVFNPGRVYMTVIGWGDDVARIVLYRSDDKGVTWRHVAELPAIWTGAYMTSLPSGKLYIGAWFGSGPPHQFGVLTYDPATDGVSGPLSAGNDLARTPGTRMAAGSEGISRIASLPDGDYLRMHCTYRTNSGDYGLVVRVVRVSAGLATVSSEYRYVPPAGTSVVGPSVIETDRLEWHPEEGSDAAMLYWYETNTGGSNGSYGPARVVGQRIDGTIPGERFCLSLDGAECRTWPVFTDVYGDYHRGAFWYDSAKRKLGFLALWAEQGSDDSRPVRTNVLTLKQRRATARASRGGARAVKAGL